MPHALLTTKLYVPQPRLDLVPRPRLIERLNEGLTRKLTLLSAPAGFGKTTLLSDWVKQSEIPVAWVSLDDGDNDLARFLAYLIAALQTLHAELGETTLAVLQSPQPPPVESMLTPLINELAEQSAAFALVLDAVSTVNSHIKSVYSKLDVHSRIQAVERARELNLLSA